MNRDRNPVNVNKLPGSKWTATHPQSKEKHFLVLGWELDKSGNRTQRVEIEAILTGVVRRLEWRQLADRKQWLIGWQ